MWPLFLALASGMTEDQLRTDLLALAEDHELVVAADGTARPIVRGWIWANTLDAHLMRLGKRDGTAAWTQAQIRFDTDCLAVVQAGEVDGTYVLETVGPCVTALPPPPPEPVFLPPDTRPISVGDVLADASLGSLVADAEPRRRLMDHLRRRAVPILDHERLPSGAILPPRLVGVVQTFGVTLDGTEHEVVVTWSLIGPDGAVRYQGATRGTSGGRRGSALMPAMIDALDELLARDAFLAALSGS